MPPPACRRAPRSRSTRSSRSRTSAMGTYAGEAALAFDETVTARKILLAREAGARVARVTPGLDSWTIAERARPGSRVVLKAENLQRTGSFKLRGAAAKL